MHVYLHRGLFCLFCKICKDYVEQVVTDMKYSASEPEPEPIEPEIVEETVNSASALWAKARQDISDDDYKAFYKHVAHDFQDPLTHLHSKV